MQFGSLALQPGPLAFHPRHKGVQFGSLALQPGPFAFHPRHKGVQLGILALQPGPFAFHPRHERVQLGILAAQAIMGAGLPGQLCRRPVALCQQRRVRHERVLQPGAQRQDLRVRLGQQP